MGKAVSCPQRNRAATEASEDPTEASEEAEFLLRPIHRQKWVRFVKWIKLRPLAKRYVRHKWRSLSRQLLYRVRLCDLLEATFEPESTECVTVPEAVFDYGYRLHQRAQQLSDSESSQ